MRYVSCVIRCCLGFGLAMAAVLPVACNKGGPAQPSTPAAERAQVSGSVTYDGKPVPLDSSVTFYCKAKDATASGKVDTLGHYSLSPAVESKGIPAGRYEVMIRPPEAEAPPVGSEQYTKIMMSGKGTAPPEVKEIPKQFHTLATSGIVLEVKPGPNTFDFDLAKLAK